MAIVKWCRLTPGCVFTVRGENAASKEKWRDVGGLLLAGKQPIP